VGAKKKSPIQQQVISDGGKKGGSFFKSKAVNGSQETKLTRRKPPVVNVNGLFCEQHGAGEVPEVITL